MCNRLIIIIFALSLLFNGVTSVESNEDQSRTTLSVSFVFDTTSSMGDVLQQMRRSANKIFEKIESMEMDNIRFDYVLVLFNDPGVSDVFITEDKEEFSKKLWEIQVYGGGDCPENSLTGLSKAIEVSSTGAHIFLFTDADSNEKKITQELSQLISLKKPKVYFILTGKCYDDYDAVYQKIADKTKGHVFIVPENEVETLLNKFVANLVTYRPPQDASNLAVVPLPPPPPASLTSIPLSLKIDQFPDKVYEYDEFTLHCSLITTTETTTTTSITGVVLTLTRDNVTVAEKLSSAHLSSNSKQVIMVLAFNVQKAKLSDAGVYVCQSRLVGAKQAAAVITTTKLVVAVHKRQVRQRNELAPVHEGQSKEFVCNLDGGPPLKWERNNVILSKSSQSIHLSGNDVKQTRQLACFTLNRNANVVDEIIFDILIGVNPQVDIKIENTTTTTLLHKNKQNIHCFVKGRLVTFVQILMGYDNHVLLDTSRHGGLVQMKDDLYQVSTEVDTSEGGEAGVRRYICVATSIFGVGSGWVSIEYKGDDPRKTQRHSHQQTPPEMLIQKSPIRVSRHEITYDLWSPWSTCSGSCGTGYRSRYKKCNDPSFISCSKTIYEVEICHLPACIDIYRRHVPEHHDSSPANNEAWMGRKFDHDQFKDYSKNKATNCPSGYSWDLLKQICVDIDECRRKNVCPRTHRCVNYAGTFKCLQCPSGYAGVKNRCLDINECSQNKHNCSQICVNQPGNFTCKCQRYYELQSDGVSCYPQVL